MAQRDKTVENEYGILQPGTALFMELKSEVKKI